jgi:hypothetical protein
MPGDTWTRFTTGLAENLFRRLAGRAFLPGR